MKGLTARIRVNLSHEASNPYYNTPDEYYERKARECRGESCGSGYDFSTGWRDLSFEFKTPLAARKFISSIKRAQYRKIKSNRLKLEPKLMIDAPSLDIYYEEMNCQL